MVRASELYRSSRRLALSMRWEVVGESWSHLACPDLYFKEITLASINYRTGSKVEAGRPLKRLPQWPIWARKGGAWMKWGRWWEVFRFQMYLEGRDSGTCWHIECGSWKESGMDDPGVYAEHLKNWKKWIYWYQGGEDYKTQFVARPSRAQL